VGETMQAVLSLVPRQAGDFRIAFRAGFIGYATDSGGLSRDFFFTVAALPPAPDPDPVPNPMPTPSPTPTPNPAPAPAPSGGGGGGGAMDWLCLLLLAAARLGLRKRSCAVIR
jgi:hypothetical protein